MNEQTRQKWDSIYRNTDTDFPAPCTVLQHHQHLLDKKTTALDLACGRGANALCLAENGLDTSAWDISAYALQRLAAKADEKRLTLSLETRDLSERPPQPFSFDVIVVSRFLERNIMKAIKNAVKSGGLIFYQTFIREKADNIGPNNTDYLLNKNELLHYFNDWQIIFYVEEGLVGDLKQGIRNEAMLIAQRPDR